MSNELFPTLPGLEWDTTKKPVFKTKIMESVNGRELRASYQSVPKYEISLSYAFLRERQGKTELQQLESFFLARRGAWDSFLFQFPDDNQYECQFVGDGVTTQYQVYKKIHNLQIPLSHVEAISDMADLPMWRRDESSLMWSTNANKLMWTLMSYQISSDGILTLSQPLEAGEVLIIRGTFYYRCRFADDEQEYTNFMSKLWHAKKINLIGSLGNKI